MVIVYCEKCGLRVPEDQLQSGLAICSSENKYFCKNCAGSLPKAERDSAHPANTAHAGHAGHPGASNLKSKAHARAVGRAAAGAGEKGPDRIWFYAGGAIALVVVAFFAFGRSKPPMARVEPPKPAPTPAPAPAVATVTPSPLPVTPTTPATTTPASTKTVAEEDPGKARIRESERQFEIMREQRGAKLLAEAQEFARANPNDPWAYKDQLEKIVNGYRSSPAGEQAAKLIAGLKMPDGPRPAPPAPPAPAAGPLPANWTGEPGADGWRATWDRKSPPFRGVGFGIWKIDGESLLSLDKVADQTNFSFGDGEIRIRFSVDQSSWVQFSFHQTDAKPGAGVGFARPILEPLWGKPVELIVRCEGDNYSATFNGQPVDMPFNGCAREGRIHINNAKGSMRLYAVDYRPLPPK